MIRRDGLDKLTGQVRYLADTPASDCWWGGTVRSPTARGRIRAIQFDPAINWTEFVVVDHRDIPGKNAGALFDDRQPVLAVDHVNHQHEPILLLAHPSKRALRHALAGIEVVIDPLPAALDFSADPTSGFTQLGDRNMFCEVAWVKGDPDAVLRASGLVVEGSYQTGGQEHYYLEPQGMEASLEDGVMVVRGSLQCPFYVRDALGQVLNRPSAGVRVIATPMGGGFGGKEDYPSMIAAHAALLALRSPRPVRLLYDRHEDLAATTKRHPARTRYRTAVSPDGELRAMQIDLLFDGGAYATLSPIVLERAALHATGAICGAARHGARSVLSHGRFRSLAEFLRTDAHDDARDERGENG